MFNFLHTFNPSPVLISLGPINIYWYGLFMVLGVLAAIAVIFKLSSYYAIKKEVIIDLAFWLIIGGIIGARIYHILVEWSYYFKNPLAIFKIWQGGLAIYGAIFIGLIILWFYAKKSKINFWLISSLIVPGMALGQAIGRWGNYFNQELFGKPTDLAWGIMIDFANRPLEYASSAYFQPVFLYESLGDFLIFLVLLAIHILVIKKIIYPVRNSNGIILKAATAMEYQSVISSGVNYKAQVISLPAQAGYQPACAGRLLVISYLILYSMLRFILEFVRIDQTILILGLRFPQVVSLLIIVVSVIYIILILKNKKLWLKID